MGAPASMIRRLGRRLRFGERIVRADEVRPGQRVLRSHGMSRVDRVARAGPRLDGEVVCLIFRPYDEMRLHRAAPVLVQR